MKITQLYTKLVDFFGENEYWWPHETTFEIVVGAILTQNTTWLNVEKAITNLKKERLLNIESLAKTKHVKLEEAIRPAGFYRQKAKCIFDISRYLWKKYDGNLDLFFFRDNAIIRKELLSFKGIGKETADSILLYAGNKLIFIIDAYTKRICTRIGITSLIDYDELQFFFHNNLDGRVAVYKIFHGLIVELGKNFCKKKPLCKNCPMGKECAYLKNIRKRCN